MRILLLLASLFLTSVYAQTNSLSFPSKPVKLIVGFAAGGGSDSVARLIAPKLSEVLGQSVIIENRPGGGGNIASELLTKTDPDGYTIMLTTIGAMAINPHMPGGTPYDPNKDFAMISQGVVFSNILVVRADSPIKTLDDFVKAGKSDKDFVSFGSSGNGSTGHLAGELLKLRSGMKAEHINYKGGGQAMTDLLGGNIQGIFASTPTAIPFLESGKLRALAVTSPKRTKFLPNVPTIAELGYPGYQANNWYSFVAPPKTSPELIKKLNSALVATLKDPVTIEKLHKVAVEPAPSTPEELAAYTKSEYDAWGKVIKNIKFTN